uniref:Uncharacterized protein n=1 Tax=Romanomermis culicivorax TaxID=13658 RepID=A0A915KDA3_ROMCU
MNSFEQIVISQNFLSNVLKKQTGPDTNGHFAEKSRAILGPKKNFLDGKRFLAGGNILQKGAKRDDVDSKAKSYLVKSSKP